MKKVLNLHSAVGPFQKELLVQLEKVQLFRRKSRATGAVETAPHLGGTSLQGGQGSATGAGEIAPHLGGASLQGGQGMTTVAVEIAPHLGGTSLQGGQGSAIGAVEIASDLSEFHRKSLEILSASSVHRSVDVHPSLRAELPGSLDHRVQPFDLFSSQVSVPELLEYLDVLHRPNFFPLIFPLNLNKYCSTVSPLAKHSFRTS